MIDDVWTGPGQGGCPGDIRIEWRIEGMGGVAIGDIGWCKDPYTSPSSIRHASKGDDDFKRPTLEGSWFPDAFGGTMRDVFTALETSVPCPLSARDNLRTLALDQSQGSEVVSCGKRTWHARCQGREGITPRSAKGIWKLLAFECVWF